MKRFIVSLLLIVLAICTPKRVRSADTVGSDYDKMSVVEKKASFNSTGFIPFAFSISGGVSLGSYEAGLNWAYISYLSRKRSAPPDGAHSTPIVTAVSGASAGSINAFLTAISWCRADSAPINFPDTVDNNIFQNTWLEVDIEELLPDTNGCQSDNETSVTCYYDKTDGLLSRAPINKVVANIVKIIFSSKDNFRPECEIPMAFIVTRNEPASIDVNGITVKNNRFVIPVQMTTDKERNVHFKPLRVKRQNPAFGNVIQLRSERAQDGELEIPIKNVFEALLASSAFPLAFGQKYLEYCKPDDRIMVESSQCPTGYNEDSGYFIDGGVFDNIPLGTAKALAEPWPFDSNYIEYVKTGRATTYLYMDPDNLRKGALQEGRKNAMHSEPTYGIIGSSKFLGGALSTGRNYELFNQLSSGAWTHRTGEMTDKIISVLANIPSAPAEQHKCSTVVDRFIEDRTPYSPELVGELKDCLVSDKKQLDCLTFSLSGMCADPTDEAVEKNNRKSIMELRQNRVEMLLRLADKLGQNDVGSFIKSGKEDYLGDRRVFRSSRFAPLTGNYLSSFGAFIDRSFREYDYFVGVYDGIINLADIECSTMQKSSDYTDSMECRRQVTESIFKLLKIEDYKVASQVFIKLAREEQKKLILSSLPDTVSNISENEIDALWPWLPPLDYSFYSNATILTHAFITPAWDEPPKFEKFLKTINGYGSFKPEGKKILPEMLEMKTTDDMQLLYPLIKRAILRLEELEIAEASVDGKAKKYKTISFFGELLADTSVGDNNSFRWNQGFAHPDWLNNLLPHELSFDLMNGGIALSWEPRIPAPVICAECSIKPKITPVWLDSFGDKRIWFSQIDVYLSKKRDDFGFSSWGLGPLTNITWERLENHPRVNFGAAGYLGLLADKLRITVGARSLRDSFSGDNVYFTLGITDFQGIIQAIYKSIFK